MCTIFFEPWLRRRRALGLAARGTSVIGDDLDSLLSTRQPTPTWKRERVGDGAAARPRHKKLRFRTIAAVKRRKAEKADLLTYVPYP